MNYDETKELRKVLGDKGEYIESYHEDRCESLRYGTQRTECVCGARDRELRAREQYVRLLAMAEMAT